MFQLRPRDRFVCLRAIRSGSCAQRMVGTNGGPPPRDYQPDTGATWASAVAGIGVVVTRAAPGGVQVSSSRWTQCWVWAIHSRAWPASAVGKTRKSPGIRKPNNFTVCVV